MQENVQKNRKKVTKIKKTLKTFLHLWCVARPARKCASKSPGLLLWAAQPRGVRGTMYPHFCGQGGTGGVQ